MNALEIRNLTKSYPGFMLDNLNLTLPSGCIMGLIGENGAGKSTTIKLILDMIHKDSGSITILRKDNGDHIELTKEDVGVVMDEAGIPECLTVKQVGNVMKHTFRNWDNAEYIRLAEKFALPDKKQFKEFSRGMHRDLTRWFVMKWLRCLVISQETRAIPFSFLLTSSVILKNFAII